MSSEFMISLQNVWKKYSKEQLFHRSLRDDLARVFRPENRHDDLASNEFWALKDVSLSLKKGEAVGLYGHNGAGKSTILKLMAGVTHQTGGSVLKNGSVAPLLEVGAGFHPDLTGRENIFMNGAILGMKIREIKRKMESIIDFSEIGTFIDMPVKKYSSGMYLRLAFSIAIHSDADIYLIDEIIAVGDAGFQQKCIDKIRGLKAENKTLLLVSHNLELMSQISDRIVTLEKGVILQD